MNIFNYHIIIRFWITILDFWRQMIFMATGFINNQFDWLWFDDELDQFWFDELAASAGQQCDTLVKDCLRMIMKNKNNFQDWSKKITISEGYRHQSAAKVFCLLIFEPSLKIDKRQTETVDWRLAIIADITTKSNAYRKCFFSLVLWKIIQTEIERK